MPITEKSLPYELTMSLLLTPDRPGVPMPVKLQEQHRAFVPLDSPITEATGAALARWAAGNTEGPTKAEFAEFEAHVASLTDRALAVTVDAEKDERAQNIKAARSKFGSDLGAYQAWLGAQVERLETAAAATEREQMDL
jgi:hypothetical protein